MGFIKKVGKFLKKATRDIATVVGFAIAGPAGAAIGQGVGSLAEGRDLKKSVGSALKVYGGANIAAGAGLQGGQGLQSLNPLNESFMLRPSNILDAAGGATVTGEGLPGLFQSMGADFQNLLTGSMGGKSLTSPAFKGLSTLEKAVLGLGLAGAAGGITGEEQGGIMGTPDYFSSRLGAPQGGGGLTGAVSPFPSSPSSGLPSVTGGINTDLSMDPLQAIIMDELMKRQLQLAQLPTFDIVTPAKNGGAIRLADGGELPKFKEGTPEGVQVDLTESGGETSDPNGSGDEDTIPALLADGEFVMTKQAVKGIGNGNHEKGIETLYAMMNKNENKAERMGLGRA